MNTRTPWIGVTIIGFILTALGYVNMHTYTNNCSPPLFCIQLYDERYKFLFFGGIIVTLTGLAGLLRVLLSLRKTTSPGSRGHRDQEI